MQSTASEDPGTPAGRTKEDGAVKDERHDPIRIQMLVIHLTLAAGAFAATAFSGFMAYQSAQLSTAYAAANCVPATFSAIIGLCIIRAGVKDFRGSF